VKRIIRPFILSIFCLSSLSISALAQSDELSTIQLTNVLSSTGTTIRGASYDGKRIVFESKIDYTGENADGNNEIFVFDGDSGKFIQITKTADIKDPADATKTLLNVSNTSPVISGDGNHIVFTSNAKLTDAANDDGNQEIYMATLPRNTFAATFLRITNTDKNTDTEVVKEIFNNYSPTVNADGTLIAFLSTRRVFKALENGTPEFINNWVSWGAGTRAAQFLTLGAKARALLQGRAHVTSDDLSTLAGPVLRHRVLVNYRAEAEGVTVGNVIERVLSGLKA